MHQMELFRKCPILGSLLVAVLFAGCRTVSVNVPLENARVSEGYINSQTLTLGHLFLWDTEANTLTKINVISQGQLDADVTIFESHSYDLRESGISSSTTMSLGGTTLLLPEAKAAVKAAVSKVTRVTLTDYQTQGLRDARFALDCKKLRSWRHGLAQTYPDPKYKFIFISDVVLGNKIEMTLVNNGAAQVKASVPQIGNADVIVTYDGKVETKIVANNAPLVVSPQLFTIKTTANRVSFEHDTQTRFDFQHLSSRD